MDNSFVLKIEWKCAKCCAINSLQSTRLNVANLRSHLVQRCSDCKNELIVDLDGRQEEPKW
jgi:phage FluMu protein Com